MRLTAKRVNIQVTLFRDFAQDHRVSMEVYADGLSWALHSSFAERCTVREGDALDSV